MSIESRLRAAEKLAAAAPPAPDSPAARVSAEVRKILNSPEQLAEALAWDERFLADPFSVGETDDATREKDARAFALLLSETAKPFSERN